MIRCSVRNEIESSSGKSLSMIKLGLIGYPLGHSFSEKYFSEKFKRENIDGSYELVPLAKAEDIQGYISSTDMNGFNVTIPYKQSILNYLKDIDEEASEIGAVNTVKITIDHSGKKILKGFNTDWKAFRDTLIPLINKNIKRGLILGTGGAAKAVGFALRKLGIQTLYVSRTPDKTMSSHSDATFPVIGYDELTAEIMSTHLLIVNCSPMGMSPQIDSYPHIPYDLITSEHICYDLVYNPEYTNFLSTSAAHGATIKNGLEMLHKQADFAWKIWNGELD